MDSNNQAQKIFWVTLRSAIINVILGVFKLIAGFAGNSAAMIADAIHTFTDLITDTTVIFFTKYKARAADYRHDYGRGKIETLTTVIIGFVILAIGIAVCYHGVVDVIGYIKGETLQSPGYIALIAAIISAVIKEWSFHHTIKSAAKSDSITLISNAWHHRSDAFSSVMTALFIAGAIFLGEGWRVLDPIAVIVVSLFIMRVASHLIIDSAQVLIEESLPDEKENQIAQVCLQEEGVKDVRKVNTRLIGRDVAIEVFVTMPANDTVEQAHRRSLNIEDKLIELFGVDTYVNVHIEPDSKEQTNINT